MKYILSFINFTQQQFRLTKHGMPPHRQALLVSRKFYGNIPSKSLSENFMTKLIILILTFGVSLSSNGQTIDIRIQKEIDTLRLAHVDTFLIYSVPCVGCERIVSLDTCSYEEEPWYLLWKKSTNYYLQKFDFCKNYKPILLDTLNPLSFYLMYGSKIDKEEIKPPTYLKSKNIAISSSVDHTWFYEMTFLLKDKKVFKKVSHYDLTFTTFDNGRKNMYALYNQHTRLKKLIELIDQMRTE